MRKNYILLKAWICFFLLLLIIHSSFAQNTIDSKKIEVLLQKNSSAIGLSSADLRNVRISDAYLDKTSGMMLVYLQQTYKGVDIYKAVQSLAFKNDKAVSVTGTRISKIESKTNRQSATPAIMPADAVKATAAHLKLKSPSFLMPLKNAADNLQDAEFNKADISSVNIKTKLKWVADEKTGNIKLAWQVELQPLGTPDYWLVNVDAANGTVIGKDNLTVSCDWKNPAPGAIRINTADNLFTNNKHNELQTVNSASYRVVPYPAESPVHPGGTPTLVTNPWNLASAGNPATTLQWNDDGTKTYKISRGNNVYAQEDHDNNSSTFGKAAESSTPLPDLVFDYTPNFNKQPTDSSNLGFALTNLFYWNNIMHDITYQYGFDEVAGNFQENNLGRGGAGTDMVIAEGQDAGDFNNANFYTPADGSYPRMQMYLWDPSPYKIFYVNKPDEFEGFKLAREGQVSIFNLLENVGPVSGEVVLYNDDEGGTTHEACSAAANADALNNKIALIDRGTCNFTVKIKNAQNAGAKAVLVANNIPAGGVIIMGGTDYTITIPAVMITFEAGDTIKNYLNAGTPVNVTLQASKIQLDGDLDNGVIAHEYTHGISNRLTGGPSQVGCLQNGEQMGEGWSDYAALMVTTDWSTAALTDGPKPRPIGNYAFGYNSDGPGIRLHPYSTDIAVNPWTYADMITTGGEPHYMGEIWCSILWDMTWNIIQKDGVINPNFYDANAAGGNSVAMKLVMEGLKLQACSPGFEDGRDAILKADTLLYGGKYSCAIWSAFARRGLGVKASQGSPYRFDDGVTDFSEPSSVYVMKTTDKDSAAQGEQIQYSLNLACQCTEISNYTLIDTLSSKVTYVSGGTYNASDRTVTFSNINLTPGQTSTYTINVSVNDGTYTNPDEHINEDVANNSIPDEWNTSGSISFKVSSKRSHSGKYSLFAKEQEPEGNARLTTKSTYPVKGLTTFSFWHYYDTELGYDGGVVEISTDGGNSWADLGSRIVQNGYTGNIAVVDGDTTNGRKGFTGSTNGEFIQTIIDLSSYAGMQIRLRFVAYSDQAFAIDGWYIDDIVLKSEAGVYNRAQLLDEEFITQATADTITRITDDVLPIVWGSFTAEKQGNTGLLKWQTLEELNALKFIVERSINAGAFHEIGSVQAKGTSQAASSYTFIDRAPLNGTNYYRLRLIDKDGKMTTSETRSLTFSGLSGYVSITPNPARDKITITISGNEKPVQIFLTNTSGQQVKTYTMSGQYELFNLPHLAPGVYYITVKGEGISEKHKLVIQ